MKKILQIDSSIFSEAGVSNELTKYVIEKLQEKYTNTTLTSRDLANDSVPHLDASWITALGKKAEDRSTDENEKVSYSDQLISEVSNADIIVIGLPMYNFSVPSVLKAWFDHIARANVTFKYTSEGPEGLLINKKVYLVTTRGGFHKGKATDTLMPYVKTMLNFIGLNDVEVAYAEGLHMGSDGREKGIHQAQQAIQTMMN